MRRLRSDSDRRIESLSAERLRREVRGAWQPKAKPKVPNREVQNGEG